MEEQPSQYVAYTLFTYTTAHLSKCDKVRFYYALKGRDGKSGIIRDYNVKQMTKTVLFVPPEHSQHVKEFLSYWKCSQENHEVLVR